MAFSIDDYCFRNPSPGAPLAMGLGQCWHGIRNNENGGFAIGAFERSFNKNFKMMIIKTDANGK
jgi:hypothetical protein